MTQRDDLRSTIAEPPGGCQEWTSSPLPDGYGQLWYDGRARRAHRVAYVEHHGISLSEIDGLVVRHTCDNPPCINPTHLRLGTHADNTADKVAKQRHSRLPGEMNGRAKLTDKQAEDVRARYARGGVTQQQLANFYGVAQPTISDIIRGRRANGDDQ